MSYKLKKIFNILMITKNIVKIKIKFNSKTMFIIMLNICLETVLFNNYLFLRQQIIMMI